MNWHEYGGYDWCILETLEAGPFLGLTLGYGLVHEPLAEFGTLQLLAGMLQTELARPIEMSLGRVTVPEVSVHVGADTLDIQFSGAVETLSLAWQRLVEVFAGQHTLDPAEPVEVRVNAAPRDLTSRFGMTSLTLGASDILNVDARLDPLQLLHYLNPTAGNVRAVMYTNAAELAGDGFAPPTSPPPAGPEPSRYCASARTGALHFPRGHAIISTVVPRTSNGAAAVRVLAQQTAQHVSEMTQRDDGVAVSVIPLGPDMLATVMTEALLTTPRQRSHVQQLLVSRAIPDHRVEQAVEGEAERQTLSRVLDRRVHGLPDEDVLSVAGTQRALTAARSSLRFFTEPGSTTPRGFGDAQPELPSPKGQRFKGRRSQNLTVGTNVLERYQHDSRQQAIERVDLDHLELVITDGKRAPDILTLIDHEFRVVEIVFDDYRKERRLRDLIAERTAGVPTLTARIAMPTRVSRGPVTQRSSGWRLVVLVPVVLALALLASWLVNGAPGSDADAEPESESHHVQVAVGETATTVNWSRVTVQDIAEATSDRGHEYTVAIEYCAAEDDVLVQPKHFRMLYGENTRLAHVAEVVEDPLKVINLEAGECTTGNLGFSIPDEEPTDLKVDYRPGDLSSLTWVVEDPQQAA